MLSPYQLLDDGKCHSCSSQVDDNEIIKCFQCKAGFHAVCDGSNDICNKSLLVLYKQKSSKRNFTWFCDKCLTHLEAIDTEAQTSQTRKVDDLEKKIDILITH